MSVEEFLLLLGERDVMIYQLNQQISQLKKQIEDLTPKQSPVDNK